jgi:NAD(P)-dependent dehydrogenase (short-subunit alcohol dehydrogenase family)
MGRLTDKVVLIVGCGSVGPGWGNGRAMAVLFAREGASIFGGDIDMAAADETARLVRAEGGTIDLAPVDVTDEASIKALVEAAMARFGRIDVLVNNVGGSAPGGPVEMATEVWDRQFDTNIRYVFLTCKYVIPIMEKQFEADGSGGSIVNLASIAGLRHFGPNVAAYAASKAGLIKFTEVTAVQYAPKNIRLNIVVPGLMHTPLVETRLAGQRAGGDAEGLIRQRNAQPPMGRMGDAWDVAHAALYFASDEAKYVTGAQLTVDGGLSAAARQPPA